MFNKTGLLKWRNAFTAFLIAAIGLTACSKKDNASPDVKIEFEKASYGIPQSGEVTLKVITSANVNSTTTIPFTISGSAVKGTDYTLSAESFIIAAGTNSAEVKVTTTASFDKNKSFKVELGTMPAGATSGNLLFTEVSIQPKDILIYSFEYPNVTMTETAEINLTLQTGVGSFVAEKEMRIPVELAQGSTAVEGVNFSFDGTKEIVVPAGKSKGTIKLKFLKQEAGKDLIVLKLAAINNHYVAGNFATTKVSIFGSNYTRLIGTWKYKAFSNIDWLVLNTTYLNDDPATLPSKNTNKDLLIFGENGLTVQMTGDVKNYFRDAAVTNLGEVDERLQEVSGYPKVKMQLVQLSAMNVNFSATKQNIRPGQLGLRVFTEAGKEILEVTIIDYEPTSFLANTYNEYKYYGDVPVFRYMPIRYQFERVN
ncbi:MAG: Calx-beta domain-containing protein [Candidatus Pedobacter colombiensis]|uniref:Calx-beta domain-containing protein n=1 Tax=Candidatus Pedobacter colombiensis TaxID=3121371 RepID=A0AAJ5W5H6_9SPHI|nr:Calx-beta domain-containing protein [Pedobacter sp.]WEK17500.1 MAG: Calx-beta domain-containing protein [Pedobacter sp.]